MRAPYELARGHIALAELALETGRPEEAARELGVRASALDGLAAPAELEPGGRAQPSIEDMTCLTRVYSSSEYCDRSLP